jgi:hypothetical protein
MNPGMMIGMLAFAGILAGVAASGYKIPKLPLDETTPRYSTHPFRKHISNSEGERIVTEYAMLTDDKRDKVREICIKYYRARYKASRHDAETDHRAVIELYTKFGSFDAIIEHFQPSNKH